MEETHDLSALWNDAKFASPPVYTYKCVDKTLDISRLHTIVSDAISFMENQEILHREAAIISRLVYTMGRKFRHDIGHSYVRRTNTALLKYLNLQYINDIQNLLSVTPDSFIEDYIYVPTRQMVEYVLIRTQTLGKIMFRINLCAKKAALFYFERLKRGDSAWLSIMPYSVLSRVWLLTKTFLKNICKWYNGIFSFMHKLNHVGKQILPCNYQFPEDFSVWINIKELDVQSSQLWKSSNILSKISESEVQQVIEKQYENCVQEVVVPVISNNFNNQNKKAKRINEDIGEKISRNEYVKTLIPKSSVKVECKRKMNIKSHLKHTVEDSKENSNETISKVNLIVEKMEVNSKKIKSKHNINSVKCLKSLKLFLKTEENLRTHDIDHALSKTKGIIQWQSMKKTICKKMLKLISQTPDISPVLISKTFQQLWLEKCQ